MKGRFFFEIRFFHKDQVQSRFVFKCSYREGLDHFNHLDRKHHLQIVVLNEISWAVGRIVCLSQPHGHLGRTTRVHISSLVYRCLVSGYSPGLACVPGSIAFANYLHRPSLSPCCRSAVPPSAVPPTVPEEGGTSPCLPLMDLLWVESLLLGLS
jgi:hypothetical protein